MHKFTNEEKEFIYKNYKGLGNLELTNLLNFEFKTNLTIKQIKNFKRNHKLNSGLTGRFEKNRIPLNKGTKGMYNVGGNRTSFKPGQRSSKWVPVGTEVIKADGFLYVKVSDIKKVHSKENWKQKHRLIWEKEYGPIPKGHKLVFADSDKTNIVLDNLLLVTNSEMLILNRNKLIYTDKSLTETGLLLAKIIKAQNGRMKKHERK